MWRGRGPNHKGRSYLNVEGQGPDPKGEGSYLNVERLGPDPKRGPI